MVKLMREWETAMGQAAAVLELVTALATYENEADKVKMTVDGCRKALEAGHLNALLGWRDPGAAFSAAKPVVPLPENY